MKTLLTYIYSALAIAALSAVPVAAQDDQAAAQAPTKERKVEWRAGIRFGQHDFSEAEQSVDAVFNGDSASLFGFQVEAQLRSGLFFGLSMESGGIDGKRVVLIPNAPPIQTNIDESLDIDPLRLTAGWMFRKDEAWAPVVGLGFTDMDFTEEGGGETLDGSGSGLHLMGGIRYQRDRFSIGAEVMLTSAESDELAQGGVTRVFGEDDLGGTSFHLVALFHF